MKTIKTTSFILLFVLLAACSKDNNGRIRIFAKNMVGGNSGAKVWVDPSSTTAASSSASWVVGESINLNGSSYPINQDNDDNVFYLNTGDADLPNNLYAVYPANVSSGGNNVTVTNSNGAGTVVIESLAVNYRNGGHDIIFPMVATAQRSQMRLLFRHLTAGMRLTLTNSSEADKTLGSVKIVTYGESATASAIGANGYSVSWAKQGPTLPGGEIGSISGDQPVGYASEMLFTLKNDGTDGKVVPANKGQISLCVPVTVNKIKTLVVTGYSTTGEQLFVKSKTLTSELTVEANKMYTIPEILF